MYTVYITKTIAIFSTIYYNTDIKNKGDGKNEGNVGVRI